MRWSEMRWSEMRRTAGLRVVASALLWVACGPLQPPVAPCERSCVAQPGCSMRPIRDDDPKITDPLQAQLSCGPLMVYMNGFVHGVHGGYGSFCPDTPVARTVLHDNHKTGYKPGFCSTCLGVPQGWIFVIWQETTGPTCDSGCPIGPPAPTL